MELVESERGRFHGPVKESRREKERGGNHGLGFDIFDFEGEAGESWVLLVRRWSLRKLFARREGVTNVLDRPRLTEWVRRGKY